MRIWHDDKFTTYTYFLDGVTINKANIFPRSPLKPLRSLVPETTQIS